MDINRSKLLIVSLFWITICFCLLPLSIFASSRGITVKAKTSSGAVKEIQLYSGYHALVVGVSDYDKWPDLPYATKDAQDVAQALKKMGFTVSTIFNPSSRDLTKALNSLAYKFGQESDRAILFYYAGHGDTEKLADGTKLGYIIPKDCPLLRDDPEGFVNNAISMKDIEAYSLRIRSKHVLMLFDSCFSGSLFSLVRAVPEDITEKSTLPVRQYITAGTEDEAVPDRSMFKRCLLLGLEGDADLTRDGYITGTELGLYLHDKVIQNTLRAQHPQYGKIRTPELARGDFIFRIASSGVIIEKPSPKPSKAYLSVESNVSAARVLIDGRYVGTTNLANIEVSPGDHQIRVEKDGYESYSKRIGFDKGRIRDLYIVLDPKVPLKNRLYVDTQPGNAIVRILNIGPAFYQGMALDAGHYHVEVSAEGYETQKMWASLIAGQDKTLDIHLKPIAASQPVVSQTRKVSNSFGMEFVYIEPGTFMMGSPSDEPSRENDEKQHRVTLTKGFYMQTTEVTQGQWKALKGSNPSKFKECGDECPVENVSWNDVQQFIRKLNQREGRGTYRLPTEAEWEYTARAGTDTPFFFGQCLSTDQANYNGNHPLSGCSKGKYRKRTIPVARLSPNAWGLYDMHGNVWEWCQDWYGDYPSGAVTDPSGPSSGSGRVRRGGDWRLSAGSCRSADRFNFSPGNRGRNLGFRLLRTFDSADKKLSSVVSAKEIVRDGRFIAYDNGVVYDKNTELEWYAGPDRNTNWNKAKRWVESLSVAGGGWRMPTREELKTLYKKGAGKHDMTPLFKITEGWYVWSGETKDSSSAWYYDFGTGYEGWGSRDDSYYYVRGFAVRSRR